MKKLIAMIAVFALCVTMLTACSFRPVGEPQATPGTYTLEQVPALTITPLTENAAVGSETFLPSNYSWSWPKGNGENEAVEACGFGPTDPAILNYLDPIYLGESVTVKLIWASFPAQSVIVVSWDVDVLDLPSDANHAQQDSYLREVTLTEAEDFVCTLLLEPDRVYDIWERIEDYIRIPDDYTLVFGHTPTLYYAIKSRLSIWHGQNRIAIDCGSGFEDIAPEDYPHQGRLACLRLDDMKEFYSREKRRTSKGDEP